MTCTGERALTKTLLRLKEKGSALGLIALYLAEFFSEFGVGHGGKIA